MADLFSQQFRQRKIQRAAKLFASMPLFDAESNDLKLFMSLVRGCDKLEMLANEQLQRELDDAIEREVAEKYVDGVQNSFLFQTLPMEIRTEIWSYLVVVPETIHLFPVKQNVKQGFRLSRCGEAAINLSNGWCNCNGDTLNPTSSPVYLDTELLLVSKTVRREVLDVVFLKNRFTFTSLRDLEYFTENFSKCSAKLQNIRMMVRLSDSQPFTYATEQIAKARRRIGQLQSLTMHFYLDGFHSYETYHHDGFISEIIHFAFPIVEKFRCYVRPSRIWGGTDVGLEEAATIVQQKLEDVFTGKWPDVNSVPITAPPPRKVPESEIPPRDKRGILALGD